MVNRNGLGSLIRNGPAPGRAGLSHLGRGEMRIPNEAMQGSPGLRQHAMQTMARMGRDPMQYTMGSGRNSVNPRTGRPEFADMVYTANGWVDPTTNAPIDFSQAQGSYANTGTSDPNAWQAPAAGTGKVYNPPPYMPAPEDPGSYVPPAAGTPRVYNPQPTYQAPDAGTPKFYPPQPGSPKTYDPASSPFQNATQSTYTPVNRPTNGDATLADMGIGVSQQAPQQSPDFSSWSSPQTYDQWRDTRNPAGKGVPNTLFGQTTGAGFDSSAMTNTMGNSGQMPVGTPVPWSIPGTALGMGTENGNNDPSILNNGYNSGAYAGGAYGGNALAGLFGGNQNGGIAFSGQGPMGQGMGQQYAPPMQGFQSSFRY